MPFEENNTFGSGRPAGSSNKIASELRETIEKFLKQDQKQAKLDFKSLTAVQKWKVRTELMAFVIPKLRSVELETDFGKLTDEQCGKILGELKKEYVYNQFKDRLDE